MEMQLEAELVESARVWWW